MQLVAKYLASLLDSAFEPDVVSVVVSKSNVGYQLMMRLGWAAGTGLGRNLQGRADKGVSDAICLV